MLNRGFLDCLFFQVFQQRSWDFLGVFSTLFKSGRGSFAVFAVLFFFFFFFLEKAKKLVNLLLPSLLLLFFFFLCEWIFFFFTQMRTNHVFVLAGKHNVSGSDFPVLSGEHCGCLPPSLNCSTGITAWLCNRPPWQKHWVFHGQHAGKLVWLLVAGFLAALAEQLGFIKND